MAMWLWINLGLGALFVAAIVGVPLWLVIAHPDTAPTTAELHVWRHTRERLARQAAARRAAAGPRLSRQAPARQWDPAADV